MKSDAIVIKEVENWITKVVIGCNFCPFAAKVFGEDKIYYKNVRSSSREVVLTDLAVELGRMDLSEAIETTILVLPDDFKAFADYLDLVAMCNLLIKQIGKKGIYQLASFHPEYKFRGTKKNDPSNFTNRSPYPLIQILRESSISNALLHFAQPESIPERNIAFAKEKGLAFMEGLKEQCMIGKG